MDFTRKIVLLTIVFVCVALLMSFYDNSPVGHTNDVFTTQQLALPGWKMTQIASDKAIMDTLEANVTVFADYFQIDKQKSVNLYMGYYNSLDKSKMSHAPQVCFTAQGWIMQTNDKVEINLAGQPTKVNRLVLEKGTNTILVYFWYQHEVDVYADLFRMKLFLSGQKILHGNTFNEGNAFIRISTNVTQDLALSSAQLQDYANDLYLELPKLFNHELQSPMVKP